MKKILVVFGTRPEAIKMAPLISELKKHSNSFQVDVCITAQHREMLDTVLTFFGIVPEYDLDLMKHDQDLYSITADVVRNLRSVMKESKPHYVLVHGDTTTSMAASLAAFYYGARVGHVEAGLRTYRKDSPFPEEVNRQITSRVASFHFCPTRLSQDNLIAEKVSPEDTFVTGNTVIDALFLAQRRLLNYSDPEIELLKSLLPGSKKVILVTGHRRENFGQGFVKICDALRTLSELPDVHVVYPVHLNPNVRVPVHNILGNRDNISLIEPLSYPAFVWLMQSSYIILTDSGGIQEEAPSLGKPVLVLRDTTERPEAVIEGTVKLVGTDPEAIVKEATQLLTNRVEYEKMSLKKNPYGDGVTSQRIARILMNLAIQS